MRDFAYNLGTNAVDTVTGFQGVITGCSASLAGANYYGITPRFTGHGKDMEEKWFTEGRIESIGERMQNLGEIDDATSLRAGTARLSADYDGQPLQAGELPAGALATEVVTGQAAAPAPAQPVEQQPAAAVVEQPAA